MRPGWYWIFFRRQDDLDQVGEAGDGKVGEHAALEDRPDSLDRVEVADEAGSRKTRSQAWASVKARSSARRCTLRLSHTSTMAPPSGCRCAAMSRSRHAVQVKAWPQPPTGTRFVARAPTAVSNARCSSGASWVPGRPLDVQASRSTTGSPPRSQHRCTREARRTDLLPRPPTPQGCRSHSDV